MEENSMKKGLIILWLYLLSFQVAYAGDFIIGTVANKSSEIKLNPLKICYNAKFNDYYPSRIFEIDHSEGKYIVYNLHVVYLDSCSIPRLKTIQAKIPKEFKGVCCHVDSKELVYYFLSKGREIIVSVPANEKDTLTQYACNLLYSYPLKEPRLYRLVNSLRERKIREKRYIGVRQSTSYTLYYYNFTRRQKDDFEDTLIRFNE
jgi:hypothetical protein